MAYIELEGGSEGTGRILRVDNRQVITMELEVEKVLSIRNSFAKNSEWVSGLEMEV